MEDTEKADPESVPKSGDSSPSQARCCNLCGCATPAVRCDRCNSQTFCLSCDDMYHRHPKRKLHLRKAVDSIWGSARSPRLRRRTDLPGDPCKIPIPPPRTKKRHTIGGRGFLKSGLELGSFGHSKMFDPKNLMPSPKDFFAGQKSPASLGEPNLEEEASNPITRNENVQIYENDNVDLPERRSATYWYVQSRSINGILDHVQANPGGNVEGGMDDRSPWNATRPNIASPIQVSIPSSSPDIVANGQSFGYPTKPHSQSAADLSGHPPYHFHPPHYPPYVHPPLHAYSHSMAHLNCAQCLSSSWSNLMSPHPSPYFHPMPWGSAHNTLARHPAPRQLKHSHGDLASYPDSNFHYPYPGASYYHNGPPVVDPNFVKELHEQAEMQKLKKDTKHNPGSEEMDTAAEPSGEPASVPEAAPPSDACASTQRDVQQEEELPPLPEKPTEPWSCVHCTFINPPGSYICQICCKTSYGNKSSKADEEASEMRPRSRDSESPLINRDALINSPNFADFQEAQKDEDLATESPFPDPDPVDSKVSESAAKLTTETQTSTSTKTTDVQTQNVSCKSIASSTDSIFPKQETSVQTEVEAAAQNCSVATDPMISSQSLESLLSGVSAPPYHNRRAGWGRGTSYSTQSLYERGRSRSPMPRSLSMYNEAQQSGREPPFPSEEVMHSVSQAWLYADPMYFKPHNQGLAKEDYFDGTWGSMDRLNRRVKHKKDKGKVESVRPKFHRSLDDLKSDKRPEMLHTQELMMLQTVKEAERCGFSLEDLHVAYLHCGKENPVYWLEDNWPAMVKNVIALAAKYGEDNEENDVGIITATEAKDALRIHRGDIWDAVTECIENRQRKILELTVRGNFTQKQIADALKHNDGNVELAYADLVRASTRRHKFILSPGLSEDSEDLNLYNPTEDGSAGLSHLRLVKTDVQGESKTEKKKSDFLTKLSAIRTAQSERRKAREEKELIRETIGQDYPEDAPKEKDTPAVSMSREDSREVEENVEEVEPVQSPVQEVEVDTQPTVETPDMSQNVKEGAEDSIPVDFDTNWSESQGEWIEEFSDEQWEDDSRWVGLGKKFQKMEKEFEEEAMQMAALWEKEELEDDVFEEETKEPKPEAEAVPDSDRKFDEWVKANLKVDSFEFEEEEAREKAAKEEVATDSLVDSIELEVGRPSPLQHYPTAHDLSLKSQFESDWVDLPADEEIEKLAHDIVCEGSDVENKFEEENVPYEEEKELGQLSDQEGSDEDWEKIEMDDQEGLREVDELDQFAFPDREGDEKNIEEMDRALEESIMDEEEGGEMKVEEDSKGLYKNLVGEDATKESLPEVPESDDRSPREELPPSDGDQPRPPVRRKSKLSSSAIEQALKNHAEMSADVPPLLPEKTKNKDSRPTVSDLYATPDKAAKESERSAPQKPPRLNLSPEWDREENEPEVPPKRIPSKDASPVTSLSNESDSNCFADSESDTEIKSRRQKNVHRKPPKYANEFEDAEMEDVSKLDKMAFEEKSDVMLESNLDFELEDDIDPALIEPLPPMKSIDFDPELPIPLGGRGRLDDLDDVDAPKAFREDTTRPLQLFKATKRETPPNTLSRSGTMQSQSSVEQQVEETSFITRTTDELPAPLTRGLPVSGNLQESAAVVQDFTQLPASSVYENQVPDKYYYNEAVMPSQPQAVERSPEKWEPEQSVSEVGFEQNVRPVVEPPPAAEEQEIALSEMEGLSAAVDYFFGRYNEVTVTRPKKKTPARAKPASPGPKPMSASEMAPPAKPEAPSEMDKSAGAVLETNLQSGPSSEVKASTSRQELQQKQTQAISSPLASRKMPASVDKVKEPAPSEYLPFAEDYLFGCYNEVVVVPRKTKTVPLAPIPKLGASLTKSQNVSKEQKPPVQEATPIDQPVALPEEPSELPPEEPEEELSKEENVVPSETSSLIYDEIFHDLPADILANQSFDEGGSIYYESFQDAVEEIQDASPAVGNAVGVKAKTVHFEEPSVPVAPPRRSKGQPGQRPKPATPDVSSESYADEYLFRQYGESPPAKKKLPVCSEDFKMNRGFEPTEFPCDTPLLPDERLEGVLSSEISVETPPKTISCQKNNLEDDFADSEQPLDTVQHQVIDAVVSSTESQMGVSKGSSVSDGFSAREDNVQSTDIRMLESFEELSVSEDRALTESPVASSDMSLTEESKILSDDLALESSLSNMQPPRPSRPKPYDPSAPPGLEMDQFVFIEPTPDIIDDSYTLYDIQESLQSSLACDLNYVDVKNNIEDECTDDSEKEWKRNEDIKNSLNASFLSAASNERDFDDRVETILDVSEKSSLEDSKAHYLESEEVKEEDLNLAEEENRISIDKDDIEGFKSMTDVTEADISEQSDYVVIDSQMRETSGSELSSEFSRDVESTEFDYESKDSFSAEEDPTESESAKLESSEKLTASEERVEYSSEIPQKPAEAVIQPLAVLCRAVTELSDTADSSVMAEDLSMQEETLEFAEEVVVQKFDQEEDSATEDRRIDVLEDLEASGELSDNGNDLSDDSLAPSTHSSVSTQIAVSMKLGSKEPEPDESSLFEFGENLENDNEVGSLPTSAVTEQLSNCEEAFTLEHVSESIDTDISEVTGTVSAPTEEYEQYENEEYEIEMTGFEYGEDIEQGMSEGGKFTPTPPSENEDYPHLSRFSPEMDLEAFDSVVTQVADESLEISGHETSFTESTDKTVPEFESEEILQDQDVEDVEEIVPEPSGYPGIYDAYGIQDDIQFVSEETLDEIVDVSSDGDERSQLKEEEAETSQVLVHSESTLHEDTQLCDVELKPESIETPMDSLFDDENVEEPSLSIMSHFYDEWYQNVQPSTQFSLFSTDSIYAKYGSAESSESGNESGDDNIVSFKPSEDVEATTENLVEQMTSKDEIKDVDIVMIESYDVKKDIIMDETELLSITEKSDFDDISNQSDLSHEIHKESGQKWVKDREISEASGSTSDFMSCDTETAQSVTFISESEESVLLVEDTSETKSVEGKFSTSKSCQTEDSFEEDIFFDSFDDTFTIPSYIHLPIEVQSKPQMADISVQCELISSEAIAAKATSAATQMEATAAAPEPSEEIMKLTVDDRDESSCESFEESDSDIFIESHSSHDELEVAGGQRGLLYAEIDSDTGFSSGSECGWTQGREKQIKGKKVSVTDVQLQEISTAMSVEKGISGSFQTFIVSEVKSQMAETLDVSERSEISEKMEGDGKDSDDKVCPLPPEIVERAVTPVAIPQFPSFEEDVVFVEVEESVEEASEAAKEEVVSTTPTVEYFYGPLPETVPIESSSDPNERFFETASELSESLSFPLDSTESFSDSSRTFSEKMPRASLDRDVEVLEEESFADTCSSFRAEDSISEYYALPESMTSKGETLILTETESSDVTTDKASADFGVETRDADIKIERAQIDRKSPEIKSPEIVESKEEVASEDVVISEPELETVSRHKGLSKKETLSEETTEPVQSQKTVCEENLEMVDSALVVGTESQVPVPDASVVGLPGSDSVEPVKPSADVPPVPSDIVRYLYYDDSITFDEDSYHTQSEVLEIPQLPADESPPVAHETVVAKDAEGIESVVFSEKSADEMCTTPPAEPEKQLEGTVITESVEEFVSEESIVRETPELPEEDISEEICIPPASKLKLATVEVISAEDVTELPSGQIPEPVVSVDKTVPESDIPEDTPLLPVEIESEDFDPKELKKTSPEVPPVPSDIVRYLYYGDDITFEDTTDFTFDDTSFHSQSDALGLPLDDKVTDVPEISDLDLASAENLELMEELPELSEDDKMKLLPETKKDSFEESSCKHESSSAGEESLPPLDSSECVDRWFDMEADPSGNGKKESEQHSSSAMKDSEQPCIPEYILSPIPEGNLPATKTDIDEVTDISTHFTMTDDSDKFSDIESDTSLNFEEECILPLEIEPVEIENAVLFESSIDEEDEDMNLPTPEVKCLPGGFHFPVFEPSGELVEKSAEPIEPQEEFDDCVTSTEFSEQHREQFAECLTSSEVLDRQPNEGAVPLEFPDDEPKELFESGIPSDLSEIKEHSTEPLTSSERHSKEVTFYDMSQDPTDQEFHDSNEISEISKEQFSECLTSGEERGKETVLHEVHLKRELTDEPISSLDVSEHFTECVTSSEILSPETGYEISQEVVNQELEELPPDYSVADLRDENGNIPESVSTVPVAGPEIEMTEKTPFDREEDSELSCYTSPVEETKVASLFPVLEEDAIQVRTEDVIVSSPIQESEQTFIDKEEDVDESCYTAPNEEDSVSTEMTDNWVDAEGKNIEVDESIYDLPLEEMSYAQPELGIQSVVHLSEEPYFGKSLEAISCEEKISESVKCDITSSEIEKADTPQIETFTLPLNEETKSGVAAKVDEISEAEKVVPVTKDSFPILEEKEASLETDEHQSEAKETPDDGTFSLEVFSLEKCLEASDMNEMLLSSDIKGISEVKMETESEMRTAVQEEVNIESVSAEPGTEPKLLSGGTTYDALVVEVEEGSGKELRGDEKVITSCLSGADDIAIEEDVKVTESVLLNNLELKQTKDSREADSEVIDSRGVPQKETVATDEVACESLQVEKEPELVSFSVQPETVELLEARNDFSDECVAAVTSETSIFGNISPAVQKIVYEELDPKEVSKLQSTEISAETKIELEKYRDEKNVVEDEGIQLRKPESSDELETPSFEGQFAVVSCKERTVAVLEGSVSVADKEADVDIAEEKLVVPVDSRESKLETSGELETFNFKGEFSIDSSERETEVVLKTPSGILDKETNVDSDKTSSVVDVDSQFSKSEVLSELETFNFKGEFSVDSSERETEVLKIPGGSLDKETDVDLHKAPSVVDVDSQLGKSETPSELETFDFKGEFSVDSSERYTEVVLKKPGGILDKETDVDSDKTSSVVDVDSQFSKSEVLSELETFNFKGEFSVDSSERETEVVLKTPGGILDEETDVDLHKTPSVVDADSQFRKPETPSELETFNFKGEFSVDSSERETEVVLKTPGGILDRETDVDLHKTPSVVDADSQLGKSETPSELETFNFKGEFSVDSSERETEVVLKTPGGILDKETDVDSDKTPSVVDADSQFRKLETPSELETFNFKGEFSVDSSERETEVVLKKPGEKETSDEVLLVVDADSQLNKLETSGELESLHFKGEFSVDSRIKETEVALKKSGGIPDVESDKTLPVIDVDSQFRKTDTFAELETVDFKGEFLIDSREKESAADIDFKSEAADLKMESPGTKMVFKTRGDVGQLCEVVDFKMLSNGTDLKGDKINELDLIESESVDFKGQITAFEGKVTGFIEQTDKKYDVQDFKGQIKDVSRKIMEPSETVDFKGQAVSVDSKELKLNESSECIREDTLTTDDTRFVCDSKIISAEIVDFKGGIIDPTEFEEEIPFAGQDTYKMPSANFNEESPDVVDFRGQITSGNVEIKGEEKDILSENTAYSKSKEVKETFSVPKDSNVRFQCEDALDIVDFKIIGNEEPCEQKTEAVSIKDTTVITEVKGSSKAEEIFVQKDRHPSKEVGVLCLESHDVLEEMTNFDGPIGSDAKALDSQLDISKEQLLFEDKTIEIDTVKIADEEITFESHGTVYHEQIVTTGSASHEASVEESSELFSCVESLSAADTSAQFYSLSDDLDDTLNATSSEDFTDVPSHFTSTEDSDKWSDVEGDFSMEDVEFDRDKTPTRIEVETENDEHRTLLRDEISKADSILEESSATDKSIQKETCAKDQENVADSDIDVNVSEKTILESDVISYPEISDPLTATQPTNFTEGDVQDVGHVSKDLLPKEGIAESKVSDSSQKEVSETLFTSVDEGAVDVSIVSREPEDAEKIIESFDDVAKLSEVEDFKEPSQSSFKAISKSEDLVSKDVVTEEISPKVTESSVSLDFKGRDLTESSVGHEVLSPPWTETESRKESFTDEVKISSPSEPLQTDTSADLSVSTSTADYIDVSTYQHSTDSSEKWSDVESEMHLEDLKEDFKGRISSMEIPNVCGDEPTSSNIMNLDKELKRDETEKDLTAEEPLMEHFAAIRSLKEQLTVANTFSSFDAETAVSKTHEDSTDVSSQFEKTESELWLEVATDDSVSEFVEDVERDEKEEVAFSDKIMADEVDTSTPLRRTSTMSTSSSYTDLDHLDQTSDTCADISLQGATTESSDRWSDIEAEALIDDVLYGSADLAENVESADLVQSIKKLEERKDEISLPEFQPIISSSVESTKMTSKSEPFFKVSPERRPETLKSSTLSFEGPDSSSINLTDSGQSSIPIESTFSSPSNVTAAVLSDDEFTNVTPLDGTTEESDKWSDISGDDDTSVEEIEEDSSISLKASLKLQKSESGTELKVSLNVKEFSPLAVGESESLDVRLSETEIAVEETVTRDSIPEKKDRQDPLKSQKDEEITFKPSESAISQISSEEVGSQSPEMECTFGFSLKAERETDRELVSVTETEASFKPKPEEATLDDSQLRQEVRTEDISESKITDESETLDTFTDVLTQTLSPETSEAYCELESDHSVEDIEMQPTEDVETHYIQQIADTSRPTVSECYENSVVAEELIEGADEYGLDTIPENELENYEDEEYSLSEHFEISEDELIYPLPYNDWIEQSFELKEYGIEAAFSESGSDIHGLGLASDIHGIADEEYDDEDIQRAIDFNISNFEDEGENNVENAGATESFKTLSNDVSPHLKHSDKEFDSWSTADAPSIEEEEDFVEHDNILSKIDELLAEDFGDLGDYQIESPLKLEQDTEGYFFKDISTPEYLHPDYDEIEDDLPEETLLEIDKESEKTVDTRIIPKEEDMKKDSEISDSLTRDVTFEKDDKMFKTETVSSEVALKKDFKLSEPESLTADVTLKKDSKLPEPEAVSSQISLEKDSKISESAVSSQISLKKDSKLSESESLSSQISLKKDSKISEPEAVSSQISLEKDSKISESAVSSQISLKKDSKISEQKAVSSQISLEKDSKLSESEDISSQISLKKDSKISEPEAVSSQFTLKKDSEISDSESVVGQVCQKKDFEASVSKLATSDTALKLSESETVTSKLSKKDATVSDQESASNEVVIQKDSKVSETETVSSKFSVMEDSKFSQPEIVSRKMTSEKDSKTFESEAVSSKISLTKDSDELETVSGETALLKDSKASETVSSQVALKKDSKITESVKQTVKTSTEEVENAAVVREGETKVTQSEIKTSVLSDKKETTRSVSSSSDETALLLSSTESKVKKEDTQTVSPKAVQSADVETEVSVKLKSGVESVVVDRGKDFASTSDGASASVILSPKDSPVEDQSARGVPLPAPETDSSFDIPSKPSSEPSAASVAEYTAKETANKSSEKTETLQSSQLSESSKITLTSESNIPEPKVQDDSSVSKTLTAISKEQTPTDSVTAEVKPDIPRKTKRRSSDTREVSVKENVEKKPSLPPKLSKRHSTSGSPSSSLSESLSSSSSMESIGSFESATSERSRKSSLKSSEDTSYHSQSPEVPARRSRSSKPSSSSRSRSRDSEDSSRSSSLKIRRRSSNFREPEPIDLSKKRASIDERMQKLQNEGKCATKEKAFIAAKLIEMQFEEEDALMASRQCNTVYNAVKFLTQLCELCQCRFPINLMTSMVHCTHRACRECLKAHFTSLIYDRSIFTLLCPVCHKPDITDQNIQEYFNHLDMLLRNILEDKVYDLFQRKLRDEVLTKDPNFHWCSQCSSGFIASPRLKKLYCPDCSAITCAMCHQTWELEHEGVHCERFQQWKDMHTPEPPPAGLVKFLVDRGVGCPSCGIVYAQACGGCLMYKCSHCGFEFCGFCIRPLKKGRECSNDVCESRGHHIHHVHDCLFYLRDKDVTEIQMLLEEESVPYLTIPPKEQIVKSRCQVREQKHAHGVITEDRCGRDIEPYCGGLCRTHYYEYLGELLRQNGVSLLSIMSVRDLQFVLRKARLPVPERMKGETAEDYYERLLKVITSTLS